MAEDSSGEWINPDSAGPNAWQTGTAEAGIAGAAGVGMEAYGAFKSYEGAKAGNKAQIGEFKTEQQEDQLRRSMMETQARRSSMENLRNAQRAGSLARANATEKGAQFGSGLQGGLGQIAGASAWNETGIEQQLAAGEQMFNLKGQASQYKMDYANAQMMQQEGNAWGSIGKDLIGAMGAIKGIAPLLAG